jgi:hypothetical protein
MSSKVKRVRRRSDERPGMTRIAVLLVITSITLGVLFLLFSIGIIRLPSDGGTFGNENQYSGTPNATEQVILRVEALSLNDTRIFRTVRKAACTRTEDYEGYVIVSGCKDGVYFRIDLYGENYVISYCAQAATQTERFRKLSSYFERECEDTSGDDVFIKDLVDSQIYSACGWRLNVRGECVLGIGVL